MKRIAQALITGTVLATLTLSQAYAGGSTRTSGSQILNGQVNFNAAVTTLNNNITNTKGDVVGQSVAGGNAVDITTMNDTFVNNNQYNKSTTIASTINAGVGNIGGSVGYSSQSACNSASVSTDPNITKIKSQQDCNSVDPSSTVNAYLGNIGGNVGLSSSSVGNTFEADSNASNMPVSTSQVNTSFIQSKVNAYANNVAGTISSTSAAIGNNAQIIHYNTGK